MCNDTQLHFGINARLQYGILIIQRFCHKFVLSNILSQVFNNDKFINCPIIVIISANEYIKLIENTTNFMHRGKYLFWFLTIKIHEA